MLLRFCCSDFIASLIFYTSFKSESFINVLEPIGNPKITMPSVVSFAFVNVFKHSVSMIVDVIGKYGSGDELFVDVRILLLSSRNLKPRLLANFLNVLQ